MFGIRSAVRAVLVAVVASVMSSGAAAAVPVMVDPVLPRYNPVQGVSGTIKSVGSDTMNNVMATWAEIFRRHYPAVQVEIEGKASNAAPPALASGQSQFGPMSRAMTPNELEEFERVHGFKPTQLRVAIDCLAIFVHRDNPLRELTMDQVKKVFSVAGPDLRWGDLGVRDPQWADKPVSLYGRLSNSGTFAFFRDHALGGVDFKKTVKEQPGSSSVVQSVAADRFGMGYSGIGYRTAGVNVLRLAREGEPAVEPTMETALSGEYPLARFLYMYVNFDPRRGLDPLRAEFVRMVFSRDGQEAVVKDGYFPVPAEIAREDLLRVGIEPGF